jgi:hypothetical protein
LLVVPVGMWVTAQPVGNADRLLSTGILLRRLGAVVSAAVILTLVAD